MYFLFLKSFLTLASSYFIKIKIISIEKTLKKQEKSIAKYAPKYALKYL